MPFATTRMDLEMITLSKSDDITFMWNLNYDTSELIYRTETDSQRIDLRLPKGRRVRDGWIGSLGLADANYCIENVNKVLLQRKLYSISYDKPKRKRI